MLYEPSDLLNLLNEQVCLKLSGRSQGQQTMSLLFAFGRREVNKLNTCITKWRAVFLRKRVYIKKSGRKKRCFEFIDVIGRYRFGQITQFIFDS